MPLALAAYDLHERIGAGGQSHVFRATARDTGRVVAIKRGPAANFSRELAALQLLAPHPNVVEFVETFADGDFTYVVLEYLQSDLGTLLRTSGLRLTEDQARMCLEQLLTGLDHLHSCLIIHRDIKPSNLLATLGADHRLESLKISDFGVAMDLRQRPPILAEGTVLYQPPEVFFGLEQPANAHHLDVWAAGCVFVELLTGSPLFAAEQPLGMLKSIFSVLGSPRPEGPWPEALALRWYVPFDVAGTGLPAAIAAKTGAPPSPECAALAAAMLGLDPDTRISAAAALQQPFFNGPRASVHFAPAPVPARARPRGVVLFADEAEPTPLLEPEGPLQNATPSGGMLPVPSAARPNGP
eukprot:EG_transcript_17846